MPIAFMRDVLGRASLVLVINVVIVKTGHFESDPSVCSNQKGTRHMTINEKGWSVNLAQAIVY